MSRERSPRPVARRVLMTIVVASMLATGCSSEPDSPRAASPDTDQLPSSAPADSGETAGAVRLIDDDCLLEEVRCGRAAVPQTEGAADLVTIEYRVLSDTGPEIPVIHLDDGSGQELLTTDDFPGRPLVVLGSRGLAPGGPSLSCPEFHRAESNADVDQVMMDCITRLRLAGIDPAGTLPAQLGHDAGLIVAALGYDEIDLIVPTWRATSVVTIPDHVRVRRIVYADPWLATDRSVGAPSSAYASIEAVWSRCAELPSCTTPGTVDEFLAAISGLDARPLDDVGATDTDDPRPIDAQRLVGAIVSSGDSATDLAYLPLIHRAILDRDAETVSAFVRSATAGSTEVDLLGTTCSLFDPDRTAPANLPSPLREDAADGIEVFINACAVWPAEDRTDRPLPLPGLTVLTQSTPRGGPDHDAAVAAGPVIVEPTVGAPTAACVGAAAAAWFGRDAVDDTGCTTPLTIGTRSQDAALTRGVYDAGTVTIELSVPDTWSDSGNGTWSRDADPLDLTNLDVYVWETDDAETARREVTSDWGMLDPEFSSIQVGERIWLIAKGASGLDTVYRVATVRIDDTTVAIILESTAEEATRLTEAVFLPALTAVVVG